MRAESSIVAKLTGLIALAVVATAFAVNQIYMHGINRILTERAVYDLEQETEFFRYSLQGTIRQLKEDAQFLSLLPAVNGIARARLHGGVDPEGGATEAEWKDRLTATFEEMLRTRNHYLRIRVVGVEDEGKELLKAERFGGRIVRTEEGKLERLQSEPHFREALRLGVGEASLSRPSLQTEQGKPVLPYTPVLRAAAPIYADDGQLFGLVMINMDFGTALDEVKRQLPERRILYVTDADGNYLAHPDPSKRYAGDLGHDGTLQKDYPALADSIDDARKEKETILPEGEERGDVLTFKKYRYDPPAPDNYLGIVLKAPYSEITEKTAETERHGITFSLGVAFVSAVAAAFLLRLLLRPLNRVTDAVLRYRQGERDVDLPVASSDEIGVLAGEFRAMTKQKNDEDWIKENLVGVARRLLGFKDLQAFAETLTSALTRALEAEACAFYLSGAYGRAAGREEGEEGRLRFAGASGYPARGLLPESVDVGEGLVGQCARDRATRIVSDVPPGYLRIASALGDAPPKHILLLPVLFESDLVGVIELASFGAFSDVHMVFLEQLAFNIGVIAASIDAGMRTEDLLEEARVTAEELQCREEELRTQQEELRASNEEMAEKNEILEEQNTQIRRQAEALGESKRAVEEKAQELELSGKYKSEFLANMSHELRTPLNSLLILARSFANNEEGNLTDDQVEEARVIYNGGLELLGLINDVLDLSKVEAGKMTVLLEDAPFNDIVGRLERQFAPVAGESGVAFRTIVDAALPPTLHTDAMRAEQVLKNLLSNAFKFTKSGSVTLEARREGENAAAFSVTDTGVGIEESKLKEIFEAFRQEDGSIDRRYGGTGLGLAIARKFAHILGGEIRVASKKGAGSVFTLVLPLSPASARPSDAPSPAPVSDDRFRIESGDRTLLIVEDDRDFAVTLMGAARRRGYKCLIAGDGRAALLLAEEHRVGAVILDVKLPDMSGMRVLERLKQDARTRHIPVHVISGAEVTEAAEPLQKGAVGYLAKPVSAEDLDAAFAKIEGRLPTGTRKALVVEDDKDAQAALRRLLKQKDMDLAFADTGTEGLRLLREERFDCVILDLRLPDMTGFAWLEEAEKAGEEPPPVIVYTAQELTEEENARLSRFASAVIVKGACSPERLLDEIALFLHSVESSLSRERQAAIRMQHDPDKMLQGRTVLLVDDDFRNSFALSKLLKKRGLQVVIADNGAMALDKLREDSTIELVIMDLMMPVMDGYQAMRAVRAEPAWQSLPVIALTARAMPEEQEKCMAAGANDYMTKPVDVERLLALLRVWLFRQEMAA
jgi:CheY-like chemotaxis protein